MMGQLKGKGWILLMAVGLLQTVGGLFQLIANRQEVFEADTGVAWTALSEAFPTVATQFAMSNQASLSGATAVGLFSLAVTYFALREGQRWSWFAMWILPAYMTPGIISLARTENQRAFAVFGGVILLLAIVGLLTSYPSTPAGMQAEA